MPSFSLPLLMFLILNAMPRLFIDRARTFHIWSNRTLINRDKEQGRKRKQERIDKEGHSIFIRFR